MFNKVADVKILGEYTLLIYFCDNTKKKYDVKPLFNKYDIFKNLALDKGLFENIRVDAGGYGISWNDDIDLSCDELYSNGTEV